MNHYPLKLTKRWNADNTVSLLCRGRVVFRERQPDGSHYHFARGWFGPYEARWNKPQFAAKRGEAR